MLTYNSQSAPTVLIVPADLHVTGADVAPPRFKFFARNVKRRGRHEVIENDRVLLAPAELRDRTEVVVVEKMSRERRAVPV